MNTQLNLFELNNQLTPNCKKAKLDALLQELQLTSITPIRLNVYEGYFGTTVHRRLALTRILATHGFAFISYIEDEDLNDIGFVAKWQHYNRY